MANGEINRFFEYKQEPYIHTFAPYDLNFAFNLAQLKDRKDDDFNKRLEEEGKLFYLNAKTKDRERAQQLSMGYQTQLDEISRSYSQNPHQAMQSLRELKRKWMGDKTNGEWGAIERGYANEQAMVKQNSEAMDEYIKKPGKAGTHPDEGRSNISYNINKIQQPTTYDPLTRSWTSDNYNPVLPTPDYVGQAVDLGSKMKPTSVENLTGLKPEYDKQGNLLFYRHGTTGEKILTSKAIEQAVNQAMKSDPANLSHIDWKNKISGNYDRYDELKSRDFVLPDEGGNPVQYNPEYVRDNILFSPIRDASKSAGDLLRQYERDIDVGYHVNPLLDDSKIKAAPFGTTAEGVSIDKTISPDVLTKNINEAGKKVGDIQRQINDISKLDPKDPRLVNLNEQKKSLELDKSNLDNIQKDLYNQVQKSQYKFNMDDAYNTFKKVSGVNSFINSQVIDNKVAFEKAVVNGTPENFASRVLNRIQDPLRLNAFQTLQYAINDYHGNQNTYLEDYPQALNPHVFVFPGETAAINKAENTIKDMIVGRDINLVTINGQQIQDAIPSDADMNKTKVRILTESKTGSPESQVTYYTKDNTLIKTDHVVIKNPEFQSSVALALINENINQTTPQEEQNLKYGLETLGYAGFAQNLKSAQIQTMKDGSKRNLGQGIEVQKIAGDDYNGDYYYLYHNGKVVTSAGTDTPFPFSGEQEIAKELGGMLYNKMNK